MDRQWWRFHGQETAGFKGEKLTFVKDLGVAEYAPLPYSGNSGAGALLLAQRFGAQQIIMLGYDCAYAPDGKRHWHGNHPRGLGNAVSMPKWAGQFEKAKQFLRAQVINASRETALAFWPRMSLEAALHE